MIRHCDGTDPNLTRHVPHAEFDGEAMTANAPWAFLAQPGTVVINCQCGLRFDDVTRMVVYPHEHVAGGPVAERVIEGTVVDEWTLICPAGSTSAGNVIRQCTDDGIRITEVRQSRYATDFALINRSALKRWETSAITEPVIVRDPPLSALEGMIINDPRGLRRITGC
jgi:hypothetical protein